MVIVNKGCYNISFIKTIILIKLLLLLRNIIFLLQNSVGRPTLKRYCTSAIGILFLQSMYSSKAKQISLEDEYNKDTGIKPEDVQRLREWVNSQPHLPGEHITDLDMILTYHCCNLSTEVSKQVLDLNLTLKTLFTKLFKDRVCDDKIVHTLNTIVITPLPQRSREGNAVIYAKLMDPNPDNLIAIDVMRTFLMIIELWQYEEGTWPGLITIMDMTNFHVGHLSVFELVGFKNFFYYFQEATLFKIKGLHYVNVPPFMDIIMSMMRPVIKNIDDYFRIHYTGYDSIDEVIPIEALPIDVGGSYISIQDCKDKVITKLRENTTFFEAESLKRVCESRRPGKPKTVSDFFGGIEGSFKKLDID